MTKPPYGSTGQPDPSTKDARPQQREIKGHVNVGGEIKAHLPPTFVEEYKASNEKADRREDKRFRIEKATLVSVVIVAALSLIQTRQAIKSAEAAKQAADAASAANDITAESVRARIDVDSVKLSQPIAIGGATNVTAVLKNTGQTPAYNVRTGITQTRGESLPDGDMKVTLSGSGTVRNGSEGVTMFTLAPETATSSLLGGLPQSLDFSPKGYTVYTFGRAEYTTLKKPHTTEFCYLLTQPGNGGLYLLRQCPKWNTAD